MKSRIIEILLAINPENPIEITHAITVGFLTGLAFSAGNKSLAASIHLGLMNEWREDGKNPREYGPKKMAEVLLKELTPKGE